MVPTVPLALSGEQQRRRGALREYFANVYRAVTSIFEGLSVTMSWMFRRPLTIQYPDKIEKPVQDMLPDTYRGTLEVDLHRCVACMLCQRSCPINCITIEVAKNAETGEREFARFDIDMGRCMYCGLCTEACNYDAIVHTAQFETTVGRPDELVLHFVRKPTLVARHKPGEGPPRLPRGSILAEIVPAFGRRRGANIWRGKAAPQVPPAAAVPVPAPPPAAVKPAPGAPPAPAATPAPPAAAKPAVADQPATPPPAATGESGEERSDG